MTGTAKPDRPGGSRIGRVRRAWPVGLALAVALGPPGGSPAAGRVEPEPVALSELLGNLSRVSGLYRDNALHFTCDETIVHYTGRGQKTFRFEYTYVHDDDGHLADYRVPRKRGERARKKGKPPDEIKRVALDDYDLPRALKRAYFWISIFDELLSGLYRYELAGEAEVLGRPAIGVRFEPVAPYYSGVSDWFGTAWIDRETHQMLKVEALKAGEYWKKRKLEDLLEEIPDQDKRHRSSHSYEQFTTEYAVVKNGMRFPSSVMVRKSRYEIWGGKGSSGYKERPVFRVHQSYENYRFFGVRTLEEIEGIVQPQSYLRR